MSFAKVLGFYREVIRGSRSAMRWLVRLRLALLFVALSSALQAEADIMQMLGKTRHEVLREYGPPQSGVQKDGREILTYRQGRVFITNGIVTEVSASLPNSKHPERVKPAPETSRPQPTPAPSRPATPSPQTTPPALASPQRNPTPPAPTPLAQASPANPRPAKPATDALSVVTNTLFSIVLVIGLPVVLAAGLLAFLRFWKKHYSEEHPNFFARTPSVPTNVQKLSLEALRELDWLRFEKLTAGLFQAEGWRAETSKLGADGGIDVYLYPAGQTLPGAGVQCKAWYNRPVGVKEVRELFGVMTSMAFREAHFAAIGDFSSDARAFAVGKPFHLIDGPSFVRRVNQLPDTQRVRLLVAAFEGDYRTPSCPQCASRMVLKSGIRGQFWACPGYPRCRSKPIAVRKGSVAA